MASEKITAMIDEIKALSVLELKELVDEICETFGDALEHIDVLPFHQLGRPKWHMLNIPYPLEDQKGPSAAMKQRVVEQFQSHGFTVY